MKNKTRKHKIYFLGIIIIMLLMVFTSVVTVVSDTDCLWYNINDDTITPVNETYNVSIGKNATTTWRLFVFGNASINTDLYVKDECDIVGDLTVKNVLYDDSSDNFIIDAGNNELELHTNPVNPALNISADGVTTKPYESACRQRLRNNQLVATGTWTSLLFSIEDYDQNNDASMGTFTAPYTGLYQISYSVYCSLMPSGSGVDARIYVNTGAYGGYEFDTNGIVGYSDIAFSGADIVQLTKGDTVNLQVRQNSGIARTFPAMTESNYLAICKIA